MAPMTAQLSMAAQLSKETQQKMSAKMKIIAQNRHLPRVAGSFRQCHHGLHRYLDKEVRTWAVLEPFDATLTFWKRPPRDDYEQLTEKEISAYAKTGKRRFIPCVGCPGAATSPIKLLRLDFLEEVDFNQKFRNIFLRFANEAKTIVLTAESDEEFRCWSEILRQYS